jgi:hypothetical protein
LGSRRKYSNGQVVPENGEYREKDTQHPKKDLAFGSANKKKFFGQVHEKQNDLEDFDKIPLSEKKGSSPSYRIPF